MSTEHEPLRVPEIFACGLNFRTAPVSLREQFALQESEIPAVLSDAVKHLGATEGCIISTCNRLEFITAFSGRTKSARERFHHQLLEPFYWMKTAGGQEVIDSHCFKLTGNEAIEHVFAVAAGADSLVVGETQITGQVKRCFEVARATGTIRAVLGRLFAAALKTAKRIRTETAMSAGAVSTSSAARELAEQIFGDLSERSVMILGAGEVGELTLKHLQAAGARKFFIANRSRVRALALAARIDGAILSLEQIAEFLPDVDIIVGASWRDREEPFYITPELVKFSLAERNGNPQFFIDLAVPRNIDPAIDTLNDVFLYNVDDLQEIVAENISEREEARIAAASIISAQREQFNRWLHLSMLSPHFKALESKNVFKTPEAWKLMKCLRRQSLSIRDCQYLASEVERIVEQQETSEHLQEQLFIETLKAGLSRQ